MDYPKMRIDQSIIIYDWRSLIQDCQLFEGDKRIFAP